MCACMCVCVAQDLAQFVNEVKRDNETLREIDQYQRSIENLVNYNSFFCFSCNQLLTANRERKLASGCSCFSFSGWGWSAGFFLWVPPGVRQSTAQRPCLNAGASACYLLKSCFGSRSVLWAVFFFPFDKQTELSPVSWSWSGLDNKHKNESNKYIPSGSFTSECETPQACVLKWLSFHDNCTESQTFSLTCWNVLTLDNM